MGYSCSAKASCVERAIMNAITDPVGVSNMWMYKSEVYFVERGREQPDGAITGTVLIQTKVIDGESYFKNRGSMRIEADGTITRFTGLPKKRWAELQTKGLADFAERFDLYPI